MFKRKNNDHSINRANNNHLDEENDNKTNETNNSAFISKNILSSLDFNNSMMLKKDSDFEDRRSYFDGSPKMDFDLSKIEYEYINRNDIQLNFFKK